MPRQAKVLPPVELVTEEEDKLEIVKNKVIQQQKTFFKKLAERLTPITDEMIDLSIKNALNEIKAGLDFQMGTVSELEAMAEDLEQSVRTVHLSQRLRNSVANT